MFPKSDYYFVVEKQPTPYSNTVLFVECSNRKPSDTDLYFTTLKDITEYILKFYKSDDITNLVATFVFAIPCGNNTYRLRMEYITSIDNRKAHIGPSDMDYYKQCLYVDDDDIVPNSDIPPEFRVYQNNERDMYSELDECINKTIYRANTYDMRGRATTPYSYICKMLDKEPFVTILE